jgi:glycosyltransferase involved in cell wall biosynthesis
MNNTIKNFTLGIPTLNSAEIIEECIMSILNQIFLPSMIIISDDGSNDSTIDICNGLLEATSIKYEILRNSASPGISSNYNNIVQNCKTEYLQILDHDDFLLPGTYTADFKKLLETFSGLILLRMSLQNSLANRLIRSMQLVLSTSLLSIPKGLPLLGTTFTRSGIIYPLSVLKEFPLEVPYRAGADILQFHNMRRVLPLKIWRIGGVVYTLNASAYSSINSVSLYPKTLLYKLDFYLRRSLSHKIRKMLD